MSAPRTAAVSQVPRAMAVTLGIVAVVFVMVGWLLPVRDRMVIIGDSITLGSAPALRAELGDEHVVDVRAWLGITTAGMRDQVRTLSTKGIDLAVINLGSNDVLKGEDLDSAAAALADYVDFFRAAGADCIYVVNIYTGMLAAGVTPVQEEAEYLNAKIDAIADQHTDVAVIDWDGRVLELNAAGQDPVPDTVHPSVPDENVHPSEAGDHALAGLVREAVDAGCS